MRTDQDKYRDGRLIQGFDYQLQAWVRDGKFVRCGHKEDCFCYGRLHEGEETKKGVRGLEVETSCEV